MVNLRLEKRRKYGTMQGRGAGVKACPSQGLALTSLPVHGKMGTSRAPARLLLPPTSLPMPLPSRVLLMDQAAVVQALARMASEIVELNGGREGLVLMGIRRRGDHLAEALRTELSRAHGVEVPSGALDITLYRDDLAMVGPRPVIGETDLPAEGIDDRTVVLVDDVLYTGRTVRAALNELMDWGRPARVLLCVLVERDGREVPIQADVVGHSVEVLEGQRVEVLVPEIDGRFGVELIAPGVDA